MDCRLEVSEPVIDVHLKLGNKAQKNLIKIILSNSEWDSKALSELLGINSLFLSRVLADEDRLNSTEFSKLTEYFFMFINE